MPKKITKTNFSEDAQQERELYSKDRLRYYKDCLRVKDRTGNGIVPFNPNQGQLALEALRDNISDFHREVADYIQGELGREVRAEPVRVLVLKSRRVGFSTDIAAQMYHFCEFNRGKNGLVVAHKAPNAQNIAQISRRFHQQFPKEKEHLKVPLLKVGEEIEWGEVDDHPWDSRLIIATANARDFARSFDYSFVHLSECAHYRTPDAIAAAKDAAQFASFIYEESTANGMDPYFYQSWQSSKTLDQVRTYWRKHKALPQNWNGKYKFFWGWHNDNANQVALSPVEIERIMNDLTIREKEGVDKFNWLPEQIEWRRRKISGDCSDQTEMAPEDYFMQEYPSCPEEAFISSGRRVFPSVFLSQTKLEAKNRKPIFHGFPKGYSDSEAILVPARKDDPDTSAIVMWENPKPDKEYILAARAHEGLKHTNESVAIIFERTNESRLKEVACVHGNFSGLELADLCNWLGRKYNTAFIMPDAVVPTLTKRLVKKKYTHMYFRKNEEKVGDRQGHESTIIYGFKAANNDGHRSMVVQYSQNTFSQEEITLKSNWLIDQHLEFSNFDGKFEAPAGLFDDGVIVTALAVYAHREAAPQMRQTRVQKEPNLNHLSEDDRRWWKDRTRQKERQARHNRRRKNRKIPIL